MQYDVSSPTQYFDVLDNDWRKNRIMEIRDMIIGYAPQLEEKIAYCMLAYGDIFGLNAQKHFVALYVDNISSIPDSKEMLASFDCGKGCIRIRKSLNPSQTRLQEFIHRVIDIEKQTNSL